MKEFNKVNELKNLKFKSVIPQDILQAVGLLDKLGYEVVRNDFSVYDAASHNGICAWDDGEITEGWLDDDNFEQVTLEELREMVGEMVGETNKCNNTLSDNNRFTVGRLLGCEVLFDDTLYYVHYIYHAGIVGHLVLEADTRRAYVSDFNLLTFFTEDGDELTFDEYVNMYYGG